MIIYKTGNGWHNICAHFRLCDMQQPCEDAVGALAQVNQPQTVVVIAHTIHTTRAMTGWIFDHHRRVGHKQHVTILWGSGRVVLGADARLELTNGFTYRVRRFDNVVAYVQPPELTFLPPPEPPMTLIYKLRVPILLDPALYANTLNPDHLRAALAA